MVLNCEHYARKKNLPEYSEIPIFDAKTNQTNARNHAANNSCHPKGTNACKYFCTEKSSYKSTRIVTRKCAKNRIVSVTA